MNIVLVGPPGSGKGTQAKIMSDHFRLPHISTGDIFREHLKKNTSLGQQAKLFINRGELVPDELVLGIVRDRLEKADCQTGFLLDGFPRNLPQAKALAALLPELGMRISHVLYLDVPENELFDRLKGRSIKEGRSDDSEETIRNRLKIYYEETMPLISYYQEAGLLQQIPGVGSVEDITQRLIDALQ
jgi:adenylate kinase